jgi:hypothetical protein
MAVHFSQAATTVLSLQGQAVGAIAIDGTTLYYGTQEAAAVAPWLIAKCDLPQCLDGGTQLASTPGGTNTVVPEIVTSGGRVYFVSGDGTQILSVPE